MRTNQVFDVGTMLADPATAVVVTCGSGGVGKTTTAAAMALWAADAGRKVAVLTIDPAKRLAQSLGLDSLDNDPRRVEVDLTDPSGELWAMMLDTRRTFDEMVSTHSTPDRAEQILANPFYQVISGSFSGTQEYMAMEKLSTIAARREYDLIVVDTPPSRSALDFLDAPQRLSSFLDGRMIRLLSAPSRGMMKVVGAGLSLFSRAVASVIGGQMLADAAQFVRLFEDMFGGFRQRAQETYELLRAPGTAFVVVSICEADSLREASYFAERLRAEHMPLAGLVLNRTHPPLAALPLARTEEAAQNLEAAEPAPDVTLGARPPKGRSAAGSPEAQPLEAQPLEAESLGAEPLARAVLQVHAERLAMRAAELRMRARFDRAHAELAVIELPALPSDAHDLADLREIGRRLTKAAAAHPEAS